MSLLHSTPTIPSLHSPISPQARGKDSRSAAVSCQTFEITMQSGRVRGRSVAEEIMPLPMQSPSKSHRRSASLTLSPADLALHNQCEDANETIYSLRDVPTSRTRHQEPRIPSATPSSASHKHARSSSLDWTALLPSPVIPLPPQPPEGLSPRPPRPGSASRPSSSSRRERDASDSLSASERPSVSERASPSMRRASQINNSLSPRPPRSVRERPLAIVRGVVWRVCDGVEWRWGAREPVVRSLLTSRRPAAPRAPAAARCVWRCSHVLVVISGIRDVQCLTPQISLGNRCTILFQSISFIQLLL